MKNKIITGVGIIAITLGVLAVGCTGTSQKEKSSTQEQVTETVYTCPMHPEVVQDKPGNCPECGMELVKKDSGTEHSHDEFMHE